MNRRLLNLAALQLLAIMLFVLSLHFEQKRLVSFGYNFSPTGDLWVLKENGVYSFLFPPDVPPEKLQYLFDNYAAEIYAIDDTKTGYSYPLVGPITLERSFRIKVKSPHFRPAPSSDEAAAIREAVSTMLHKQNGSWREIRQDPSHPGWMRASESHFQVFDFEFDTWPDLSGQFTTASTVQITITMWLNIWRSILFYLTLLAGLATQLLVLVRVSQYRIRRARILKKQCLACGYEIGSFQLDRCPECGVVLPPELTGESE